MLWQRFEESTRRLRQAGYRRDAIAVMSQHAGYLSSLADSSADMQSKHAHYLTVCFFWKTSSGCCGFWLDHHPATQRWPNKLELRSIRTSVRPSVRPSIHPSTKSFSDFNLIWYLGRPCEICASVWLQPDRRLRSRSLSFWSSENCTFLGLSSGMEVENDGWWW